MRGESTSYAAALTRSRKHRSSLRNHRVRAAMSGAVCAAFGLVVCVGWLAGSEVLVRLNTAWPPMQFNTAVCFVLIGVAIMLEASSDNQLERFPASLVTVLAGASLAQHLFGFNLGIDQLVVTDPYTSEPYVPGRMAKSTAVCFVLLGLAMSGAWRWMTDTRRRAANIGSAIIILVISGAVFAHFAFGLQGEADWSRATAMAAQTATMLFLVALGWSIKCAAEVRLHDNAFINWLPLMIFLAGFVVTVVFTARVVKAQQQLHQQTLQTATAYTESRVQSAFEARIRDMQRFADALVTAELDDADLQIILSDYLDASPELRFLAVRRRDEGFTQVAGNVDEAARVEVALDSGLRVDGLATGPWVTAAHPNQVLFSSRNSNAGQAGSQIIGALCVEKLSENWRRALDDVGSSVWMGDTASVAAPTATIELNLAGRAYPLDIVVDPGLQTRGRAPWLIFLIGLITSLLLSTLTAFLLQTLRVGKQFSDNAERENRVASRLKLAMSMARVGSWEWREGEPINLDRGMATILRTNRQTMEVHEIWTLVDAEDRDRVRGVLGDGLKSAQPFSVEFRLAGDTGRPHIIEAFAQVTRHANGRAEEVAGVLREVTQQRRLEAELHDRAMTDALTGVTNRRGFDEAIIREVASAKRNKCPLSLIMVDADHFKRLNDAMGHIEGDNALVELANCLLLALRRPPDVVARYGGEEFALLLPNTDANGALQVIRRVQIKLLERKIAHADSPLGPYLTVSAGVAQLDPEAHDEPEQLIHVADTALYAAKKNGRNRVEVASPNVSRDRLL